MLVLFGLRLVRLLSAQLAVVLHCLADWLDGGRVLCKLTKTEHFFRWMRGEGRGGETSGRYIDVGIPQNLRHAPPKRPFFSAR